MHAYSPFLSLKSRHISTDWIGKLVLLMALGNAAVGGYPFFVGGYVLTPDFLATSSIGIIARVDQSTLRFLGEIGLDSP